jgi:hypothetical protein
VAGYAICSWAALFLNPLPVIANSVIPPEPSHDFQFKKFTLEGDWE